jgi:hypothetical protein
LVLGLTKDQTAGFNTTLILSQFFGQFTIFWNSEVSLIKLIRKTAQIQLAPLLHFSSIPDLKYVNHLL